MGQMELIPQVLSKRAKREIKRLMRSYGTLDALIKSMSVDMPEQSMTVNYEPSEIQRNSLPSSKVESIAIKRESLQEKIRQKQKLDYIYNSIREDQRDIWNLRFIDDYTDEQTMIQMGLSSNRNKYFSEKHELMGLIADAFYLW
jgi:ppGpp synthetase/RelA/SpoT-type nucleotidyltranferase